MDISQVREYYRLRLGLILKKDDNNMTMLDSYAGAISANIKGGNFLNAQELCFSLSRLLGEVNEKRKFLEKLEEVGC